VTTLAGSGNSGWADGNGTFASFNMPYGISIDHAGSYALITDQYNYRIRRIGISTGVVTTLAGSGNAAWADGIGILASFNSPTGISIDPSGTFALVVDSSNRRIRRISIATGSVTTLAGSSTYGTANGNGTSASFSNPYGVSISANGMFALVTDNSYIRRIALATGTVTTLTGSGSSGWVDGDGTLASFNSPAGISIDPSMTFALVADHSNNRIRRITIATGSVTTLAGSSTWIDGIGTSASFYNPFGISIDPSGSFALVADTNNNRIRLVVIATGAVTTFAGSGSSGSVNGNGNSASFGGLRGVTISPNSTFALICDSSYIRRIVFSTGAVTTLAGSSSSGWADGNGTLASFSSPAGISIDPSMTFALVADQSNNRIRRIALATSVVTTLAGSGSWVDGNGTSALFNSPYGVSIDPSGSFALIADQSNKRIRRVSIATGDVTTLAGSGSYGNSNGNGTSASFSNPYFITISPNGMFALVSDSSLIRRITIATGEVTTLAGSGSYSWADGNGTLASFRQTAGVSIDPSGTFALVADQSNHRIRRIVIATAVVTTLAGSGNVDWIDGNATSSAFSNPCGVSIDPSGSFALVAEFSNNRIRRVSIATGAVTTLAGSGSNVPADGVGTSASFNGPSGVTIDPSGTIALVADSYSSRVRKIVISTGVVTTLAGSSNQAWVDGIGTLAAFIQPIGISIDPSGSFAVVSDQGSNCIRRINIGSGFVSTLAGAGSFANGIGTSAYFSYPYDISIAPSGSYALIADLFNNRIRQITIATGAVTTLAGSRSNSPVDGIGTLASFNWPAGVKIDPSGSFALIVDYGNFRIRKIVIATRVVTTLSGSSTQSWIDGIGTSAAFYQPAGISIGPNGVFALVSDAFNGRIRRLDLGLECGNGEYCPPGSGNSSMCNPGYFCTGGFQTLCSAGYFCPSGSSSATNFPCAAGQYCPAGSSNYTLCEVGFYCPNQTTAVHVPCMAGSYCGTNGLSVVSGLCNAGYYCPSGASSATQVSCSVGQYCPVGSSNYTLCEVGFFCPVAQAAVHVSCTPGFYCSSPGLLVMTGQCNAGYYCPSGSSSATQLPCVSGQYCPLGMSSPQNCTAGSYCPTSSLQLACSSGSYCPLGSTAQSPCMGGYYCPTTTSRVQCSSGSYCPPGSTEVLQCELGFYCPITLASVHMPCSSGSYCGSLGLSIVSGLCTAGFYCPSGSSSATQTSCAVGQYCPAGSSNYTLCEVGFYCPNVSAAVHVACSPGSFCNSSGLSEVSGACSAGYYCPSGSSSATQFPCVSGQYCPVGMSTPQNCAVGSYCATPAFQVACSSGSYCPANSTAQTYCSVGSFCPTPSLKLNCSSGYYCPVSSTSQSLCAAGSICTTPSTQVVCSSGSYCPPGSTVSTQCTVGSVCVNVTSMVTCASGSYCPAGSTVQNSCAAGSYCISPSFQVTCASGSYCPAGSTASTLCAAGSYCPTPSSQIVCDAGAICPPGSTSMMMPTSSGIVLIGNNSDATTNTKCATASLNLTSVVAFNTLTITVGISVSLNSFVFADASKGQCFGCSGLAFPGIVSCTIIH
jgi:DNA-binding beta-propeller fold protein YncE